MPCPLSSITKVMADSVAKNFQLLFDYVYLDSRYTYIFGSGKVVDLVNPNVFQVSLECSAQFTI